VQADSSRLDYYFAWNSKCLEDNLSIAAKACGAPHYAGFPQRDALTISGVRSPTLLVAILL
jgi:hypothetical protein